MNKFLKEFILWILILVPIIYLATIWQKLPEIVPTHFNNDGIANGWSHKSTLFILTVALEVGLYVLMLVIPFLDPRKNIRKMGSKYYNLRFIITLFIALITLYIIYSSTGGTFKNPNLHFLLLGSLFAILGNYITTIKPNNFIGVRTPWTMESDYTWKKTHQLAGPLMIGGGIILDTLPFIFPYKAVSPIIVLGIIAIMVLVPVVYSYFVFRNEEEEPS